MPDSRHSLWTVCGVVLWLITMVVIMAASFAGYGFSR